MSDDVAHSDDPIKVRHVGSSLGICAAQTIQGFTENLQLSLHCRLHEQVALKFVDVDPLDEGQGSQACLMGIPQSGP